MPDQAERLRELVKIKKTELVDLTEEEKFALESKKFIVSASLLKNDKLKFLVISPKEFVSEKPYTRFAKSITVTSGKGGVGKTNFVLNLGILLSSYGKKVLILDADLGLANVDILLGITPKYNLYDVVFGSKKMKDILIKGPEEITIIPSASGILEMAELEESKRRALFSELSLLEKEYDIMLVDTGAGLNENVLSFILPSDEVIVITTPESTAITDAYSMIKVIIQQKKNIKISILVNMASSEEEALEVIKKMTEVVKRFLNFKIDSLGYILKDKNVPNAVKRQEPFVSLYPYTLATRCLKDIAAKINIESFGGGSFEIKQEKESIIKGFFRRMSGLFSR